MITQFHVVCSSYFSFFQGGVSPSVVLPFSMGLLLGILCDLVFLGLMRSSISLSSSLSSSLNPCNMIDTEKEWCSIGLGTGEICILQYYILPYFYSKFSWNKNTIQSILKTFFIRLPSLNRFVICYITWFTSRLFFFLYFMFFLMKNNHVSMLGF